MKSFVVIAAVVAAVALCAVGQIDDDGLAALSFKAAYTGAKLSDAFSSIFYAGDGVVLAGKRSNTAGHRIFRSTDHGRSWTTTPEPSGYSGKHVYFFGMNNNSKVIITGTGDTGSPCLLRSKDMGKTWTVILSASRAKQLAGCDPGAIFSPLWLGGSHWIACLRNAASGYSHIIQSDDDGSSWSTLKTSGLHAGCRRMIRTSYGHILCGGTFADDGHTPGLYLSQDKGRTWTKMIDNIKAFAGMAELPRGIYLAGTMNIRSSGSACPCDIYRSTDAGASWKKVATVEANSGMTYVREIRYLFNGLVYAFVAGNENSWNDRALQVYRSADYGATWKHVTEDIYVGKYGRLNSVYQTALTASNILVAATQPDSDIIIHEGPFN